MLTAAATVLAFGFGAWRLGAILATVLVAGGLVAGIELQVRIGRRAGAVPPGLKAQLAKSEATTRRLAKRVAEARDGIAAIHSRIDWLFGAWAAREDARDA
jgi:cell division protein FtsB